MARVTLPTAMKSGLKGEAFNVRTVPVIGYTPYRDEKRTESTHRRQYYDSMCSSYTPYRDEKRTERMIAVLTAKAWGSYTPYRDEKRTESITTGYGTR